MLLIHSLPFSISPPTFSPSPNPNPNPIPLLLPTLCRAGENYQNEHAEFEIVAPPADRAIYILRMIIKKIEDYCKPAAPAA